MHWQAARKNQRQMAVWSFWLLGKKLLIDRFILPRLEKNWMRLTMQGLTNLGLLGILVTGFASLALLSRGRIEDEMALESLGLSPLLSMGFNEALFSVRGGIWIAIAGAIMAFITEVLQAQEAHQYGETRITFNWLYWGCALFLLPKAIAIACLATLIWDTGSQIRQTVSANSGKT
jgi:hypothetical protein